MGFTIIDDRKKVVMQKVSLFASLPLTSDAVYHHYIPCDL